MIVVTGAAGMIGSVLSADLASAAQDALLLVDPSPDKTQHANLGHLSASLRRDPNALLGHQNRADSVRCIVHLGAISDTTVVDRDLLWRVNVEYPQQLWQWCTGQRVRFVYASSAATYGAGEAGFSDLLAPKDLKPLNAYAESKNAFDDWALASHAAGRSPPRWFGLKYFNVYGPNEYHKGAMASMVLQGFRQAKRSGRIRLFESPGAEHFSPCRDFVHVADAVAATRYFMDADADSGLYNVGTGLARSFDALAIAVMKSMDIEPTIERIALPAELAPRYQAFTEASLGRLREAGCALHFRPLEVGVADYVRNYLLPGERHYLAPRTFQPVGAALNREGL